MAKQNKVSAAKMTVDTRDEESLLLRSAESLGRVIGALQRQLDGATRRLAETADVFDQERTTPAPSPAPRARKAAARKRTKNVSASAAAPKKKRASPGKTARKTAAKTAR